jgi:hypothetical protein
MNIKKSIITALAVLIPSFSFAQESSQSEENPAAYLQAKIAESNIYNGKIFLGTNYYKEETINKIKSYIQKDKSTGFSMVDFSRPGDDRKIGVAIAHKDPVNLLLLQDDLKLSEARVWIINFYDGKDATPDLATLSNYKFVCLFTKGELAKQAQNHNYKIGTVTVIEKADSENHLNHTQRVGLVTLTNKPHQDFKHCLHMDKVFD